MPQAEIIAKYSPRFPSFRLVWKRKGKVPWEERVEAYLHWYWMFLHRYYGEISHFHPEDIALCGDPSKGRIYGVIHTLHVFKNEEDEKESNKLWEDFIGQHQDDAPEEAISLRCPQEHNWIWRHHVGQVILPDGVKNKPIDENEHILRYNKYWYHAGIYEDHDSLTYFHVKEKTNTNLLDSIHELQDVLPKPSPLESFSQIKKYLP